MSGIYLKMLNIKNEEGGTYKNYNLINYSDGYQVSIKDCYFGKSIDGAMNMIYKLKGNFGLWFDNDNNYCIDKSIHIHSKLVAILIGKIKKQQSIYDWKNETCYYL